MTENDLFLTMVQQDWPVQNQLTVARCVRRAYMAAQAKTNPANDALFDSPNRPYVAGNLRWVFLDCLLLYAHGRGDLQGLRVQWLPLAGQDGGVHALELAGKYTTLTAHHLPHISATPRSSRLRDNRRQVNYLNPNLPGFDEPNTGGNTDNDFAPFHLILAHGGTTAADFGYLRLYADPDDPSKYLALSENIMTLTAQPAVTGASDAEDVPDIDVVLHEGLKKVRRQK